MRTGCENQHTPTFSVVTNGCDIIRKYIWRTSSTVPGVRSKTTVCESCSNENGSRTSRAALPPHETSNVIIVFRRSFNSKRLNARRSLRLICWPDRNCHTIHGLPPLVFQLRTRAPYIGAGTNIPRRFQCACARDFSNS